MQLMDGLSTGKEHLQRPPHGRLAASFFHFVISVSFVVLSSNHATYVIDS